MHPLAGKALQVLWSALLASLILGVGQGIWGALLVANIKSTPAIPWSAPVMAVILWVMWQYLGGKWWPRSTSVVRKQSLRANRVSIEILAWSFLAGALAIVALAGYWIVLFQLMRTPPNPLADFSRYPALTAAMAVLMASIVSPVTEEAAFRGYCQVRLEREFPAPAAILISSVLFMLAHLTQGFFLPKLTVYFLVGVVFGFTAYVTNSTLPSLPVHIVGDLTFFVLVWPRDASRRLVWEGGADNWFWIHVAQAIVFAALSVLSFARLTKVVRERDGRGKATGN